MASEEKPTCRICFSSEEQNEIISPCGCEGSSAFIHKECLNSWLKTNRHGKQYFQCSECKHDYIRKKPSDQDSRINFDMSGYSLVVALGTAIILVMLIFTCGMSSIFCSIILFILYVITLSILTVCIDQGWVWIFVILFFIAIFLADRKIRTFITDLWLMLAYCCGIFNFITRGWDEIKRVIVSNYLSKLKPQMYDFYSKSFVTGVI